MNRCLSSVSMPKIAKKLRGNTWGNDMRPLEKNSSALEEIKKKVEFMPRYSLQKTIFDSKALARPTRISCVDFISSQMQGELQKFSKSSNFKKNSNSSQAKSIQFPELYCKYKRSNPLYSKKKYISEENNCLGIDRVIQECQSVKFSNKMLHKKISNANQRFQDEFVSRLLRKTNYSD